MSAASLPTGEPHAEDMPSAAAQAEAAASGVQSAAPTVESRQSVPLPAAGAEAAVAGTGNPAEGPAEADGGEAEGTRAAVQAGATEQQRMQAHEARAQSSPEVPAGMLAPLQGPMRGPTHGTEASHDGPNSLVGTHDAAHAATRAT
jgi:hypothetical protein